MAFISGPRQCGKTTESLLLKESFDEAQYLTWDQTSFKKTWLKKPDEIIEYFNLHKNNLSRLLVLDEIHKSKNWKQKLKGIYDVNSELINIVVTGSARLNVYRRGSDSLMGRYLLFRLHPFSLRELTKLTPASPKECHNNLFFEKSNSSLSKNTKNENKKNFQILDDLFNYSGFPEPFLNKKKNILNIWRRGRNEKIIKEDLRDLSHVKEIGLVEVLISLLADKIGSPLSIQSLREDLEVSHDTVSRWLDYLEELYYLFRIKPYSKSIPRTLKKDRKAYLYDWSENAKDGAKFENLIACHLLKACHYWEDIGEGSFDLFYLRNKEKQEVDFLLTKDKKPWFTAECKFKDNSLSPGYKNFQSLLKCPHIQVVYEENVFRKIDHLTWIMGADYFLMQFV
ncbi:MAG: ATP-binding protein [Oligoflexia bacterium]|nr:ATP-binding protein [Oligoflexia bacterium]